MCGIAGIVSLSATAAPPDRRQLDRMLDSLTHRGPDGVGRALRPGVALGNRRLAVIDPRDGDQPLLSEDDEVAAVMNGEIYNFASLRRTLEASGHRFARHRGGRSDGATIPHLVEDFGVDFVNHLDGMFAVAVHDARRRQLVLARDPMGIKPLYWARTGEHLVFASEAQAILASGLIEPRLDPLALAQLFAWEHVPSPRSLFADIAKLPAGHRLCVDLVRGDLKIDAFWQLPPATPRADDPEADADWEALVEATIRGAVGRQMVSDVPLGVLLSGGIDSSLVAAAAAAARSPLDAFTLQTEGAGYDESPFARQVARHLGLGHHVASVDPEIETLCDTILPHLADPVIDSSCFPTLALCRLARSRVTVALAGDGGDELFGGYDTLRAQQLARRWQRLPSTLRAPVEAMARRLPPRPAKKGWLNKARRFAEGLSYDPRLGASRWRCFADANVLRSILAQPVLHQLDDLGPLDELLAAPILRFDEPERGLLGRHMAIDLRGQLVDALLTKVDRMAMACSLEVRVPLLDVELVTLAQRVPDHLRLHRGRSKVLLRRVARRGLPRTVVDRPKEGFSAPLKHWLRGPLRERMESLLASRRLAEDGLLDPDAIRRRAHEHLAGKADHAHTLWAAMVVQDWHQRWRVGH